jgi:molecular chaperone GrpE
MTKKKKIEESPEEVISEEKMEKENQVEKEEISEEQEHNKEANEELEKLILQSQEYFDGWQRERADFQNYKKRIERDQASLKDFITSEIIKKYLVIIDDLELAFKNSPTADECQGWVDGINLIYQKLLKIIEGEGVEIIPVDGEFDPSIHEAISQIDHAEIESGKIVDVLRKGYKIKDRVIRPALVIVSR